MSLSVNGGFEQANGALILSTLRKKIAHKKRSRLAPSQKKLKIVLGNLISVLNRTRAHLYGRKALPLTHQWFCLFC